MAATTVNDFYVPFVRPDADEPTLMRSRDSRRSSGASCSWASPLGGQWMDRSVLDAGLAVLSLASGPVLGAFLLGVLTKRVQAGAMLAGMLAGTAVLVAFGGRGRWPGRGTRSWARR